MWLGLWDKNVKTVRGNQEQQNTKMEEERDEEHANSLRKR